MGGGVWEVFLLGGGGQGRRPLEREGCPLTSNACNRQSCAAPPKFYSPSEMHEEQRCACCCQPPPPQTQKHMHTSIPRADMPGNKHAPPEARREQQAAAPTPRIPLPRALALPMGVAPAASTLVNSDDCGWKVMVTRYRPGRACTCSAGHTARPAVASTRGLPRSLGAGASGGRPAPSAADIEIEHCSGGCATRREVHGGK